jgi:WD40 repeat protein
MLDGTARLWDSDTGRQLAILRRGERISQVAFTPDGTRALVASADGTFRLFPVFESIEALAAHARSIVPRTLTDSDRQRYFLATAAN